MAHDAHLRAKAIELRTKHKMTIDEIIEHLGLPRATIYYWIKDIKIPRTKKQTERQIMATEAMQAKYAAIREQAYQQGWDEAPELLKELTFRDFVVLYMAEGSKKDRNRIEFVNSNPDMVWMVCQWMKRLSTNNHFYYKLQCHVDHDEEALKQYWADLVEINPERIKTIRKSNSGELSGRQFRSKYGLLSISVGDTILRAKLQAWMNYIQAQWKPLGA
jgi:AcrR family transcriptional regulator